MVVNVRTSRGLNVVRFVEAVNCKAGPRFPGAKLNRVDRRTLLAAIALVIMYTAIPASVSPKPNVMPGPEFT